MSTRVLPSSRTAHDAVLAILYAIDVIDVFDGRVEDADITYDSDERVHGYAVLWAGAGRANLGRLCRTPESKQFPFQITAAGGDETRCLWVADLVISALVGVRLTIPDGVTTPVDMPDDLGPTQIDRAVNPTRSYVPLSFTCRLA